MSLHEIVCSAETSAKLRELGVKHPSLFSWFNTEKYGDVIEQSNAAFDLDHYISVQRIGAAYTVEEIFDILPDEFFKDETRKFHSLSEGMIQEKEHIINHRYHFKLMKIPCADPTWDCIAIGHGYDNFGLNICETTFGKYGSNTANAAGNMLIHLLEEKLIEITK